MDWNKAFDRQDPRLVIKSFIQCGVRPTLIPTLMNFYQDRKMTVKWHGLMSSTRDLPGGNPQGYTFGMLGFKVSSNDNAAHVSSDMKYKFVDDLSILEKINLILAGLISFDFTSNVASDIGTNQYLMPSANISTQKSLDTIQKWTDDNKMKLNPKKTNIMIFNFTEDYQFTSKLYLENNLLEVISETKLLGMIITSDLKWHPKKPRC